MTGDGIGSGLDGGDGPNDSSSSSTRNRTVGRRARGRCSSVSESGSKISRVRSARDANRMLSEHAKISQNINTRTLLIAWQDCSRTGGQSLCARDIQILI